MTSDYSSKTRDLLQRLGAFFDRHIHPNEERYVREVDENRRAGNAWIPASTYSIVTAVVDGGVSMQQAIEAPRFLVSRDPADPIGTGARVEIEDRFPRAVLQDLITRGHLFEMRSCNLLA